MADAFNDLCFDTIPFQEVVRMAMEAYPNEQGVLAPSWIVAHGIATDEEIEAMEQIRQQNARSKAQQRADKRFRHKIEAWQRMHDE